MKRTWIACLACLLLLGTVFGCVRTEQSVETTPEPTAQPSAEPTEEPAADPFAAIDAAEITDGKHDWEEGYYARFQTHLLDTALLTVHLEDNRDYSDEALRTDAKKLAEDLLLLAERTGEAPRKVTAYIVKRMMQNRPVLIDDRFFCTTDDLETGAYREALIGAGYDLPLAWKQIGLKTVVFGNPDESGLKAYYGDEAHALTASCAAVFYLPTVADAETIAAAEQTAASMTAFLLETGGFAAFCAIDNPAKILPDWAARLGIEPPVLPKGHEYAAQMTAESDSQYLATMHIGNKVFRVEAGAMTENASELYSTVCIFYDGAERLIARIREDVPAAGEIAAARYAEPIEIYLFKPGQESSNLAQRNRIYIRSLSAAWHELTHTLLWTELKNKGFTWQQEAVADYWSESVLQEMLQELNPRAEYAGVDELMQMSNATESQRAFYETFWNAYQRCKAADPASQEQIRNVRAYYYTNGLVFLLSEETPVQPVSVAEVYGRRAVSKETDGDGLSYQEAFVLFQYLVDTYGAETAVMGYLNQTSLEELYGKSYPALYQDLIAYLRETYGDLFEQN